MGKAIRFERFGGPEVLQYREVEVGAPGPGEARVAHRAIGLNFIDVYHRTGLYPLTLPSGLGGEAAGVVVATGPGVTHVRPGDRVAYTAPAPLGSYADERVLDARWLVRLPAAISDQTGAAMMLKGLTAWYLLQRSYPFEPVKIEAGIATLERVEVVAGLGENDEVSLEDPTRKKVERDDETN